MFDKTSFKLPNSFVIQASWSTLLFSAFAFVLSWAILSAHLRAARLRKRLPPGPRGRWLLGMTQEMLDPSVKPWFRFEAWSKEYNAQHLLSVPTLGLTDIIVK